MRSFRKYKSCPLSRGNLFFLDSDWIYLSLVMFRLPNQLVWREYAFIELHSLNTRSNGMLLKNEIKNSEVSAVFDGTTVSLFQQPCSELVNAAGY